MAKQKNKQSLLAFSLIELSIVLIILGLLIGSAVQGTALIAKARLYSARSKTKNSPIISIPDLSFWIESTSEASFAKAEPAEGETITLWKDINPQSSYPLDIDNVLSSPPTYKLKGFGNLPVVSFNNSVIRKQNVVASQILGQIEATLFLVHKYISGGARTIAFNGPWPDYQRFYTYLDPSGTLMFDYGPCCLAPSTRTSSSAGSSIINVGSIISFRRTAPSTAEIFFNGRSLSVNNAATSAIPSNTILSLDLGHSLVGEVGEIIIFSRALTEAERRSVETYLSQKWKISLQN